jgi:LysM repeat protein
MTDDVAGPSHAWRMVGAAGLSSLMAATGIFLLGGADQHVRAAGHTSTEPAQPRVAAPLAHTAAATAAQRTTTKRTTNKRTTTKQHASKVQKRPAASAAATTTTTVVCGGHYTVRSGDSWSLIADEAGMPLSRLLSLNGATARSSLQPGQRLCLPEGVKVVAATTAAPVTTVARHRVVTIHAPVPTTPAWKPVSHSSGS